MPLETAGKPAEERTMTRTITTIAFVVALVLGSSTVEAQFPIPVGPGFGGYGGFGPYGGGYGGYGGYGGFGNYGGLYNGYGGYGGYGGFGGYGPFNYSQQLYQQQASLTQQVFQQQQQATIGQIQVAQGQLEKLDGSKQQLFKQYLDMSDPDKAAVRARLMTDYLNLDARSKEGWKRDAVVQNIIGQDLQRLDGVSQVRDMSESDRIQYRQAMLQKYRSLAPSEQKAWRDDQIVGMIMGKDWWPK
jgi:hypothetical protein